MYMQLLVTFSLAISYTDKLLSDFFISTNNKVVLYNVSKLYPVWKHYGLNFYSERCSDAQLARKSSSLFATMSF